ncbi:hypothetical protein JCM10908_002649 [Rhodotorula pacifica]|uniref:PRCC domain-containing protein n=1 Tax=Rhodotorula pacifica TaxID=1495444 RepID=UPI0031747F3B
MGLVDYGSDSGSDAEPTSAPPRSAAAPAPVTATATATKSTSFLNLPPPNSASAQSVAPESSTTATATAAAPKRALKGGASGGGPRKILLDLPSVSHDNDDEPASKRPKLALGKNGAPLTGLAAMLPKPKNEARPPPPPPSAPKPSPSTASAGPSRLEALLGLNKSEQDAASSSPREGPLAGAGRGGGMLLPPSLAAKAKRKAAAAAAAPAAPATAPAADFFGISTVASSSSSSAALPSSSRTSLSVSSAPSFSAAPFVSSSSKQQPAAVPSSATPTASDPYPGFTQLPSGEWVAKDQETYERWMAYQQSQAAGMVAEGLDEKDLAQKGGLIEVDEAQRARDAWAKRPDQVVGGKADGHKSAATVKGIPSQLSGSAKRKHQLSSLLAAAHDNRAELEERIAQARQNRKSGSNKYGF